MKFNLISGFEMYGTAVIADKKVSVSAETETGVYHGFPEPERESRLHPFKTQNPSFIITAPSPRCRVPSPSYKNLFNRKDAESAKAYALFEFFAVHPFVSEQECERVASGMDAALASMNDSEVIYE